jgi:propanol-preferring alcohol dehydrogenase
MKAWLFSEPNEPVRLVDRADPIPEAGQVVIDVKGAGLCHSDIGIIEGEGLAWIDHRPLVLGHEVAGTISALGPGVSGHEIGERVAIGYLQAPPWGPGLGRDGGYGQKAIVYVDEIVPVPDNVPFVYAAVATDSAATAYHAVHSTGGVKEGDVVGIIGLGGLGINGARFAVLAGATVYGVDTNPAVFENAKTLGVTETFTDAAELAQFHPDVVIDFAGFGTTTAAALNVVKPAGTVVQVGLGRTQATISTNDLVLKTVTLRGSLGGSQDDLKAVLQLISDGAFTPIVEQISFDQIGEGLERLRRGGIIGRLAAVGE